MLKSTTSNTVFTVFFLKVWYFVMKHFVIFVFKSATEIRNKIEIKFYLTQTY